MRRGRLVLGLIAGVLLLDPFYLVFLVPGVLLMLAGWGHPGATSGG